MKKGTGGDPFADPDDGAEEDDESDEERAEPSFEQPAETPLEGSKDDAIVPEPPQTGADGSGVPWVYTRDNVKEDRDMVQFYLRRFVQEAEEDFVDEVGRALGTDVSKTDVREAAYVAAMRDVDAVVDELERWGFDPGE